MKFLPVGIQIYSVRDDAIADFRGTIQRLKSMGYDFVELAGLYGMEPQTVKQILDEAGMPALSAHVSYTELLENTEAVLDDYLAIGCRYVAFPNLAADICHGSPAFENTLVQMRRICEIARNKGLSLSLIHI